MRSSVTTRLSIMMFCQFFIWGAWYVTLGTYLLNIGFDAISVGAAYSTTNWGAIIAPFIVGLIADRYFPAEKVMAVLHLAGAALLWWISGINNPTLFFWALLAYAICYMPTLALANAVSFHQMRDPGLEFPRIRVLGTIGWIVAGLLIGVVIPKLTGASIEPTNIPLRIGAVCSLALGLFAFTLPHTPPAAAGKRASLADVVGLEALRLMRDRSFAVFLLGSLLISIPLSFYYSFANVFLNETGMENAAGKMTLGQMSEVAFLLLIPFFFARLGVKKMLLIGMSAWVLRYLLFAFGNNEALVFMYYAGIVLHGVCFDFFFVTGQIYVDTVAPKHLQASAQGIIHVATYGIGMLIGSWAAGFVVDRYQIDAGGHAWTAIWIVPAVMAAVVIALFVVVFRDPGVRRIDPEQTIEAPL